MDSRIPVIEDLNYTYNYFFMDYVCRLCWGTNGIIELTSFSPKSSENDVTIAEKIQDCIGIDVSSHTHPKKVCSKCLNEIEIFTEFKRFCQETERKLHDILEKGSLQQTKGVRKRKKEDLILKVESDSDYSNIALNESIEDFSDDLLLSCKSNKDRPIRKKRKARSNYCNSCHLNLETVEKLTEHKLECHDIEENGLYKCFGCEKKFTDPKKRFRHESETCKELKCGYKCRICGRFLPKRRVYEHHMRAHTENKAIDLPDDLYKCEKCLQTFENTECLREHMLTHLKKKTYVCDICGRVFKRPDYLYKHKLVHEGGKHQKCPHCDYRAVQKSSLTVHIRKHTGERPYACDICPHRCVTSSNLREHRKRHFGIKAFACKLCDKKFGYKLSLDEHMSSVHEQSELHACTQCGATYSRFRGLRRHLLAKHGKKVKKGKDEFIELHLSQTKGEDFNQHNDLRINEVQNLDTDDNKQRTDQNTQVTIENSVNIQINSGVTNDGNVETTFEKVVAIRNTDGVLYMSS